jgi:hypothetical protein
MNRECPDLTSRQEMLNRCRNGEEITRCVGFWCRRSPWLMTTFDMTQIGKLPFSGARPAMDDAHRQPGEGRFLLSICRVLSGTTRWPFTLNIRVHPTKSDQPILAGKMRPARSGTRNGECGMRSFGNRSRSSEAPLFRGPFTLEIRLDPTESQRSNLAGKFHWQIGNWNGDCDAEWNAERRAGCRKLGSRNPKSDIPEQSCSIVLNRAQSCSNAPKRA